MKLLVLAPNHRLHREQVMDLLWPDSARRAASNNLRKVLHATRRALDRAESNTTSYCHRISETHGSRRAIASVGRPWSTSISASRHSA